MEFYIPIFIAKVGVESLLYVCEIFKESHIAECNFGAEEVWRYQQKVLHIMIRHKWSN